MAANLPPEGDTTATITGGWLGFGRFGDSAAMLSLEWSDADNRVYRETWEGSLSGEQKFIDMTVRALRSAGWTGNDLETIGQLKGRKVGISIVHKAAKKSGNVYLQIRINASRPMEPAEAKAFALSMRAVVASVGAPEPEEDVDVRAPDEGAKVRQAMQIADEDIPFALLISCGLSLAFALATVAGVLTA